MKIVQTTKRFRKDCRKLKKSDKINMKKLHSVMEKLINGEGLDAIYKDHQLQGQWNNFRDCHIENDWILIYKLSKNNQGKEIITFCATGSHSNLFK